MRYEIAIQEAKLQAQAIVKHLRISLPSQIDIEKIAAYYDVFCREDAIEGSEARIHIHKGVGLVTVRRDIPEPGRKRFGIAHEFGHFVLHRAKPHRHCTETDFLNWYKRSTEEPQANAFAAELLMPERLFLQQRGDRSPNFDLISNLAQDFGTTLTSAAVRLVETGELPLALVSCTAGKVAWRCWSQAFGQHILDIGETPDSNSAAGAFFQHAVKPQSRARAVLPQTWLDNPDIVRGFKLYEEALSMSRYDTVLTLLQIAR